MLKLGKKPARANSIKLKFSSLADPAQLPKPPNRFGHEKLVDEWGMLGNDQYGCCVLAGAAHEHMLWSRMGEAPDCSFTTQSVLESYSAVTGFDPSRPDTDQGADMQQAASHRRLVGIKDGSGVYHKVEAYLAIDPGNLTEHWQAMWLFGAVGVGFRFPGYAMRQFELGKAWTVLKGEIDGGHYVPLVAKRGYLICVTWGKAQLMSPAFLGKYNDESVVYVTKESLTNRKSPEGFDYDALLQYLANLPAA